MSNIGFRYETMCFFYKSFKILNLFINFAELRICMGFNSYSVSDNVHTIIITLDTRVYNASMMYGNQHKIQDLQIKSSLHSRIFVNHKQPYSSIKVFSQLRVIKSFKR